MPRKANGRECGGNAVGVLVQGDADRGEMNGAALDLRFRSRYGQPSPMQAELMSTVRLPMSTGLPRLTAVAAAASLLLAAFGPPALAAAPATAASGPSAMLVSVAAVSESDAWAVGSLIEHWNGHKWSVVPGAKTGACAAFLNGVAASSAASAWAVGYCGKSASHRPIIERWNGKHWSVQPSPGTTASAVSQLNGVAVTGSSAWAVGEYKSNGRTIPLIEHWNGHAWQVQASPDPSPQGAELAGVTAVSADSAWAVGAVLTASPAETQSLIEHWNGHGWHIQPSISPGSENVLLGVTALTATQAWAAGAYTFGSNLGTLVEYWDGTSWQEPRHPRPRSAGRPPRHRGPLGHRCVDGRHPRVADPSPDAHSALERDALDRRPESQPVGGPGPVGGRSRAVRLLRVGGGVSGALPDPDRALERN